MQTTDPLALPSKFVDQALLEQPVPTPENSYQSSVWTQNVRAFIAQRIMDRRNVLVKFQAIAPEVKKLQDALQNRQFEAVRKSSQVLGLRLLNGSSVSGIMKPEFDLFEAAGVFDAEPYVRASITRQLNIWFKEKFLFVSQDNALADYVNKRFRDMSFVTGIPTIQLFKMIVRDLLKYSNAFVVKYRNVDLSGIARAKPNRPAPVAGYFPVSALNMYPRFEDGKLISWVRYIDGDLSPIEIDPKNVIHFTFDLEPDFMFGKPRTLGAVEDIAALRRIEENVEVLIVKYLFPLLQFTVGTPEAPAQYLPDGVSEIDVAKAMISEMQQEGMLVGTERHKLESVETGSKAMDARHYLAHFKSRVFAALGVSPLDLGEGDSANRSTADNISQNLKERVMEDQGSFAAQVQHHMVSELLLEHPNDISAVLNYDKVTLHFPEVDLDNKIKKENHSINLYNNDGITESEFRAELGKMPVTPEQRTQMRFSLIEVPMAIISAVDEPWTKEAKAAVKARTESESALTATGGSTPKNNQPPAPGTGTASPGRPVGAKKKGTPKSRPAQIATTPTNQHGTNPAPTKKKSSREAGLLGIRLTNFIGLACQVDSAEELEIIVNQRFIDTQDNEIIKNTLNELNWNTIDRADRYASLFAAFLVHADHFKNGEEMEPEND